MCIELTTVGAGETALECVGRLWIELELSLGLHVHGLLDSARGKSCAGYASCDEATEGCCRSHNRIVESNRFDEAVMKRWVGTALHHNHPSHILVALPANTVDLACDGVGIEGRNAGAQLCLSSHVQRRIAGALEIEVVQDENKTLSRIGRIAQIPNHRDCR
jgi:hypothetical protein